MATHPKQITGSSATGLAPSETSSLLSYPPLVCEPDTPPSFSSEISHWKRWKVAYLYALFILVINFGSGLRFAPEIRLMELAVCRRYYLNHDSSRVDGNGNVPESLCKLDILQSQLAMLRAWMSVFGGIVGILVALPFGVLADTKGRRLVTALSLFSNTLSKIWIIIVCYFYGVLQPEAMVGSSLFLLLGGGDTVLNAVVTAALYDSTPVDKRTAVFFYTSTMCLVSELIATPLGALIMTKTTLSAAMIFSTSLEFSGLFILLLTPETLRRNNETIEPLIQNTEPSLTQTQAGSEGLDNVAIQVKSNQPTIGKLVRDRLHQSLELFVRPIQLVSKDRVILLGLPASLTSRLLRQVVSLLLQWSSKKLGWTIAAVSVLVSVRPAVNIILFALILPNLSRVLASRLKIPIPQADLLVAKGSAVLLVSGLLIIGIGQSLTWIVIGLIVYTLGWGFDQSVKLWLTARVEQSQIALLYTAMSIVSSIGGLAEAPLLAASFSRSLSFGGVWAGLPFFAAGGLCAIASVGVWVARWR